MASLSLKYHVLGDFRCIRSVIRRCTTCGLHNAKPSTQRVGQLPKERVEASRVFEHVGLDYAGPFFLKLGNTRKPTFVKCLHLLFVCKSVKAVHLELVSDLTTEAFLSNLKRFVARRGIPSTIHSDHDTNFVGADNELNKIYKWIETRHNEESIMNYFSSLRIKWKYILASAPHFVAYGNLLLNQ